MSQSRTLARERGGPEWEHGEERVSSKLKKGRFQRGEREGASKENLPRRSRGKHEQMSGRKSTPEGSGES